MKTNKFFFAIAAMASLSICSCSKDEQKTDYQNGEIRLSSATMSMYATRGKIDPQFFQFENGDSISVFINEDASSATTNYDQPLQYIADGVGGMTPPTYNQPYFPKSGKGVNIYACYPSTAASAVGTSNDFTVQASQNIGNLYKKNDLMLGIPDANPVARKSAAVQLTFTHQLSKVIIRLSAGDGLEPTDLMNATVKLKGLLPTISFNPQTGITGMAKGSSTDITSTFVYDESTAFAIIVPQAVAQNAPFIEVTLASGGVLTYKMAAATTFESGKEYQYNINVKLTGLSVTSTIATWTSIGGTVTGDAEMPAPVSGPIMEFGKAPYGLNTVWYQSTTTSYNNFSGYVSDPLTEKVYAVLEIAPEDEPQTMTWTEAVAACKNKDGNAGWRLPRLLESSMISTNSAALETYPGFKKKSDYNWTGAEASGTTAWYHLYSGANQDNKTAKYSVRCVREKAVL